MRSNAVEAARPARLVILWFGIQLAWGAILGISLQARSASLASQNPLGIYALIGGLGAFAAAVTQLLVAPLSDHLRRTGDRRLGFYIFGAAAGAIAIALFYVASTVTTLLAAFVIVQIALNVVIGPYQAVIPDFIPAARYGIASGWMAAMQSAGNAAGAVLATVLGNTPALGGVIALVLFGCMLATASYARRLKLQEIVGDQRLVRNMSLVDLFISRAFVYLGFYTLLGYLFFYVRDLLPRGVTLDATTATGLCILLFTVVGALGAVVAARPADRLDERLLVSVGGSIVALALIVMASLPVPILVPFAIVFAGIGWGIFLCADWAFACRVLPSGALATAMAIWNIAVVGPQMLAPIIVTALLTRLGNLNTVFGPREAFGLSALEILIGAAWIWRLPRSSVGK